MVCKKCGSENLTVITSGPHYKLICEDCLTFQTFLKITQATDFMKIKRQKEDFHGSDSKR